jgi:hypothetical protein
LRISVETAGPDRDTEGFPRPTEHAHGSRLVFTRENARDGLGHALEGASSAEPTRSIREQAEIGARADVFRDAFKERGQGQRPPTGGPKRVSRLGAGVPANVTAIPENRSHLALSEGRNETRRPLISLGYARLKPNPVGQQRLHSTIFPFGPPKIRPRKFSNEKGGRIPRDTKSPPPAVLR